MNSTLMSFILGIIFLSATSCGKTYEPKVLHEETLSEEEITAIEGTGDRAPADVVEMKTPAFTLSEKSQIRSKWSHLDPNHVVPAALLQKAVEYFEANQSRFANKNYISVIDFSKKSSKVRFFVVDLKTGSVWALHTAHGSGSDRDHDGYAESFGNVSGSNKSSLGFYKTAETYQGRNGYSLRLDGLSSTNSNVRSRAIVVHGAKYVYDKAVIQGRSSGCPAVSHANRDKLINKIKGGSLIYAGLSGVR